jgi:energy-coupling factor transport system ATP-binding protein
LAGRVGFVFQNPDEQLFERNVMREVSFGPQNLGFSERKIHGRTRAALRQVGLVDKGDVNPYDLLPHERKLLAIASSLAMDTPILVLDEPAIGQDAAGRELIAGILRDLHKDGRTIVLISHDLDFCAELAERAVVMADGRILADGPASEVFSKTETLERAAVHPPQLIRLAQSLKLPGAPLNVRQFLDLYSRRKRKKRK